MAKQAPKNWQFNRQINISAIVQLIFLACLIVGSWVNLQSQLDLLQRDVAYLCQCQKNLQQKLESLSAKSIAYDYRLKMLEHFMLDPRKAGTLDTGCSQKQKIEIRETNNEQQVKGAIQ